MARFGSRRAIIEEVDRLTRLQLLKPAHESISEVGSRKGYPKIKNEPNPQWREIDTPSLLISGEKIEEKTVLLSATPPKPSKKVPKRRDSPKTVKSPEKGVNRRGKGNA
jgi:hypothetical protein